MAEPPTWSNVKALLHFDGAQDSQTITDSSSAAHSFSCTTSSGYGARLETSSTYVKFGTACLNGNSYSDYAYAASDADWQFGTGDWIVDFWIYSTDMPSTGQGRQYVGNWGTTNEASWSISLQNVGGSYYIRVLASEDGSTWDPIDLGPFSSISGAKTYFYVTRVGDTIYGFVDGTLVGSDDFAYDLYAGSSQLRLGNSLVGYMDEFRLVKGEGGNTSTFTAPTSEYSTGGPLVAATATQKNSASGTALNSLGVVASEAIQANESTSGLAAVGVSLPITIGIRFPVSVGLPIIVDVRSAVTPTLPISLGQYAITPTLPIKIYGTITPTLPTLPITIFGDLSDAATDGLVIWRPKVLLDGTDISSKLFGAIEVDFEEEAAPVASFGFIPAAGTVDPLCWVGKDVRVYWQQMVAGAAAGETLVFSGIVSDPSWNANDRTVSISATGDLQAVLDRMDKTAIETLTGGTYSDTVFGDPDDLSGYEFTQALVSTTPNVLWQDASAVVRCTPFATAASADFTFDESQIFGEAQVLRYAGRSDITNTVWLHISYRYGRRRQRNLTFSFAPEDLRTPSTYLSGNLGGWQLPQRTQIESAANGGGWVVIGDITYSAVWPNGLYSTYSDSGVPMMEGLSLTPEIAADWCIGARWTAAKRWVQSITEVYSLNVVASDSVEAVGTLATEESYALEDPAKDETWESDENYTGYVSGASIMGNGLDRKANLDSLRDDFVEAQEVALAKCQNDILRSHRGTTVTFSCAFQPQLDLSHTCEVDTTYLQCRGKTRRLIHRFDLDSGDATTEIELALSRHNGTGLASSDPLTPPSEPGDPDETPPDRYHRLGFHLGGQDDRPVWDDTWDGYVVNVPFSAEAGSATILGSWQRNPANPALKDRIYEEGFHVLPPEIDSEYADPVDLAAAATYDVEVPEDPLVLISG